MILVVQKVANATVTISDAVTATIGEGIVVLAGIEREDNYLAADKLGAKLLNFRLFSDDQGKMNRDIREAGAQLLLVPQFTLAANTQSGRRPGFSSAAPPDQAIDIFDYYCEIMRNEIPHLQCGTFGAHMQVNLTNDGPVTFILRS